MKFRYYVIAAALIAFAATSFGASGDKPNQMNIPFRNVSSSTKPANCVQGDMLRNGTYIFMCSTSAHWRRIAIGSGF